MFVGSGSDGLNDKHVCEEIKELVAKDRGQKWVNVVYLGTATYDKQVPREKQTKRLLDTLEAAGFSCKFCPINVVASPAIGTGSAEEEEKFQQAQFQYELLLSSWQSQISSAHVIIVSGGNTLYAVTMWKAAGIVSALREARDRGAVLCGGSAGAICWFDAGHSDSADPDSFRSNFTSELPDSDTTKSWNYIRVGGLGFLPGLVCPHFDRVQSNGVLRREDFEAMLLRQPLDIGLGIDHWAALVVDGDNFYTMNCGSDKPGTLGKEAGVFLCRIIMGKMRFDRLCEQGCTKDLLRWLRPKQEDENVTKQVMSQNPLQTFTLQ